MTHLWIVVASACFTCSSEGVSKTKDCLWMDNAPYVEGITLRWRTLEARISTMPVVAKAGETVYRVVENNYEGAMRDYYQRIADEVIERMAEEAKERNRRSAPYKKP